MSAVPAALHSSDTPEWGTPPAVVEAARRIMGGIDLDPASSERFNRVVQATHYYDAGDNGFDADRSWFVPSAPRTPARVFLNPPGGWQDACGARVVKAHAIVDGEGRKVRVPRCEASGSCGRPAPHTHEGPTRSAAKEWWWKLAREWLVGHVYEAVFVGFNVDILQTTQLDAPAAPATRIRVLDDLEFLPSCLDFPCCFPSSRLDYLSEATLEPATSPPGASMIVWLPPASTWHGSSTDNLLIDLRAHFGAIGKCR